MTRPDLTQLHVPRVDSPVEIVENHASGSLPWLPLGVLCVDHVLCALTFMNWTAAPCLDGKSRDTATAASLAFQVLLTVL